MKNPIFTLTTLAFLGLSTLHAQVKVGDNPTSIDASAALEVESSTKGFLPPRMTTAERNAISNPAEGLTIYNTDDNCLQWSNGNIWVDACNGPATSFTGADFTNGFQNNNSCTTRQISVTPCSEVVGATLNNNTNAPDGIEYDWTDASNTTLGVGFGASTNTRALVEINGQCWARFNMNIQHNTGNSWCYNDNNSNCNSDGRLYNWQAAMNGSTSQRAQGICPIGWHIPSDCEWMYLENSLGMSVSDQRANNWRSSGSVGAKLSGSTPGAHSSGFRGRLAGERTNTGTFRLRDTQGFKWTSSQTDATHARYRSIRSTNSELFRQRIRKEYGLSVRCIKD